MEQINTRETVLSVLMDIEHGEKSDIALSNALFKKQFIDKQDRAFITRLAEGVTERRITLDFVLDSYSKTKTKKMKPLIRNVLRMGAYQLLFMDGVPAHAAVSESVKLVKKHGFQNLSGFCNGVLRSVERGGKEINYPKERLSRLSVEYSAPLWLCEKLLADYPEECEGMLAAAFTDRKTAIRVNLNLTDVEAVRQKLTDAGITVEKSSYSDRALLISGYDSVRRLPGFLQGEFSVQDESGISSMDALHRAAADAGIDVRNVWDVCAAPGGKTMALAELLPKASFTAMDISEGKLERISENVERIRQEDRVRVLAHDATEPFDDVLSEEKPQIIICDAPCSGLGVLGHKNDIKYRITQEGIESLVKLQREILDNVAAYVAEGGLLLYSTCTVTPEENEGNATWFLETHPEYKSVSKRQFIPGRDSCDGFYYHIFLKIRRDSSLRSE